MTLHASGFDVVVPPLSGRLGGAHSRVLHDTRGVAARVADQVDDLDVQGRVADQVLGPLVVARGIHEDPLPRQLEHRRRQTPGVPAHPGDRPPGRRQRPDDRVTQPGERLGAE